MNMRKRNLFRLFVFALALVMALAATSVSLAESAIDMVVAESIYGWVTDEPTASEDLSSVTVTIVPVGKTEKETYTTAAIYNKTNDTLENMAAIDEANVVLTRIGMEVSRSGSLSFAPGVFVEICKNANGDVIDVRRVLQAGLFFDTAEYGGDLTEIGSTVKHRGAEGTGIMTGDAGRMVASGWVLDKADGKITLGDGNEVTQVFIEEYAVSSDVKVYEVDNATYASTEKAYADVPVTPKTTDANGDTNIYATASEDRKFAIVVFDSDYTAYDAGSAQVEEIYYFAQAISDESSYVGNIPENNRIGSDLSASTQGSPKPTGAVYLTSALPFTVVDGLMWSTGDIEALTYLFYGSQDGNYTLTRFDTGWPKAGYQYWKNDEAALKDLGLDSRDITRVLLSHGHSDHYGTSFDLWEMIVRADENANTAIYETYEDGVGYDKYGFADTLGALPLTEYAFRSVITNWYEMDSWLELGEGLACYPTLTPGHTAGVASSVFQVTVGEGGMKNAHMTYDAETGERVITDYNEGDELYFIYMGGYGINGLNNTSTGYLRTAFAGSLRYLQSVLPYLKTSTGQLADGIYNLPQHTNQFPYLETANIADMYNEQNGTDYPFLHFLREGVEEVANFAEKRASAIMSQAYDAKYEEMVAAQGTNPYDEIDGLSVKIDATNADPAKLFTVEETGPYKHEGGETVIQIAEDTQISVLHGYDVFLNQGVVAEDAGIINSASSGGSAMSDFNVSKGFLFAKDGFVYAPDTWFVQICAHVQDDYDGNVYSNTGVNEGIEFTSGPVESYHGEGWFEIIRTEGMTKAEAEALAATLQSGASYKVNLKKTGDIINAEDVMNTFVPVE